MYATLALSAQFISNVVGSPVAWTACAGVWQAVTDVQDICCFVQLRVPTGQGKLESQGICVVRESITFLKVRENDLVSCRLQISVIFCVSNN